MVSGSQDTETANSELDELDLAILHYLERNGRATNYEVGEAVGLSASAASRRIQALEASGAIRGYRALVDDRLLGKRRTVYIRVTLERQSADCAGRFETAIRRCQGDCELPPDGGPIRLHAGGAGGRDRRLRAAAPERVVAAAGSDAAGDQLCAEGCAGRAEG